MKYVICLLILALSLAGGSTFGADSSPAATPAPADPALERYAAASTREDWGAAAASMREALSRDAGNADFHNLYAYSLRKGQSPDMDLVFKHYNEALRLNSRHRGAHEYIGEAYLMVGNLGKAKEHLAQLDRLCFFPCGEYSDLKKAVAEYEAKQPR